MSTVAIQALTNYVNIAYSLFLYSIISGRSGNKKYRTDCVIYSYVIEL